MYISDIHTHSIASGHGTHCTISDMAKAASKKGLRLLGITDHGPATLAAGTPSYFRSLSYSPRKRFGLEVMYGPSSTFWTQREGWILRKSSWIFWITPL